MPKPLIQHSSATATVSAGTNRMRNAADVGLRSSWAKPFSLLPAVAMLWATSNRNLDAVTCRLITRQTGDWALSFLILTLAITALAFFYGFIHVAAWRVFKLGHALLHSLAYLSAIAGIVHYWLLPAIGVWKPVAVGLAIALLLFARFKTSASRTYGGSA